MVVIRAARVLPFRHGRGQAQQPPRPVRQCGVIELELALSAQGLEPGLVGVRAGVPSGQVAGVDGQAPGLGRKIELLGHRAGGWKAGFQPPIAMKAEDEGTASFLVEGEPGPVSSASGCCPGPLCMQKH